MRTSAIACALLTLLAALPLAVGEDECRDNLATAQVCEPFELRPPHPVVPHTTYWGKYYLWVSPLKCTSPLSNDCRGQFSGGTGVEPPTGAPVGVGLIGVLWEETNGVPGLQRSIITGGGRPADRVVLA